MKLHHHRRSHRRRQARRHQSTSQDHSRNNSTHRSKPSSDRHGRSHPTLRSDPYVAVMEITEVLRIEASLQDEIGEWAGKRERVGTWPTLLDLKRRRYFG